MAKTLLYNGQIITVNKTDDIADAMVIEDERIIFVGNLPKALKFADKYTEWKNLQGCAVLPGFVDCHIHMAVSGAKIDNRIDLSAKDGITSISALLERIKTLVEEKAEGDWIIGSNYSHEELEEKRHVTKGELDEIAPKNPVLLIHKSGHISMANTLALEKAKGIGDIKGAEKGDSGELTGLLKEGAHFAMLKSAPVVPEDESLVRGIEKFSFDLVSKGITTAHDAGGFGAATFRTLQQAKEKGVLHCRVIPMLWTLFGKEAQIELAKNACDMGFFSGLGDDMLKIGPLKIMVDGSAVGGTCATSAPLAHLKEASPLSFSQEEVEKIVVDGHRCGFQMTAHAVGDRAIEVVLNAFEKAMKLYPKKDSRHRIEHCFLCDNGLAKRIKELGVIPVPNPGFLSVWGGVFEKYYGDRIEKVMPIKTFFDMDIPVAFGSDAMVINEYEPLFGIAAAMERRDLTTGKTINEGQCIDLLRAIRGYTYMGAYASFEEKEKGSLEGGKLADFVILSDSLINKTPDEIRKIKVNETYISGRLVFNKKIMSNIS